MKKLLISFILFVMTLTITISLIALCKKESSFVEIGSFIILSFTLIVLIWYAYDTNTIAKLSQERWMREGVLNTTYSIELPGIKGDAGRTLFKISNTSNQFVRAKVKCNFKIYGDHVSASAPYNGEEIWLIFPKQFNQGWFEIASLLQIKGMTVQTMIDEITPEISQEQLTMDLEIEFWDELGAKRSLPKRLHYFDFNQWAWIPHITERLA